ncbi:helix-turn-helix domain-containing protein [Blautia stercoris]
MEESTMGARILRRRKEKGLTQEALANKLGVSNQAVSKWEGDVCCPDLQLLPLLADTLELSLDELFGRESMAKTAQKAEADSQILPIAAELPWEDDDAIHAVLFQGHRLLQPKQGACSPRQKRRDPQDRRVALFRHGAGYLQRFFRRLHRFDDLRQRQSR